MRKLFSEGDDLVIKDYILLGLSNDKVYIDSAHVLQNEVFGDNVLLCSCSNCKFENNDTPFEASLYIPVDVLLNHNKEYQVDNCIEFVDGPDMLTMQNTDLFDHTYELGNFWLNHIEGDLMGYKDDVYVTLELYIPTNFISKDEALQNEFLSVLVNTKNGLDTECFRVPDITIPLVDIKELDDAKFKKFLQALVLKEMGNRCPDFYKKITGESFQVQKDLKKLLPHQFDERPVRGVVMTAIFDKDIFASNKDCVNDSDLVYPTSFEFHFKGKDGKDYSLGFDDCDVHSYDNNRVTCYCTDIDLENSNCPLDIGSIKDMKLERVITYTNAHRRGYDDTVVSYDAENIAFKTDAATYVFDTDTFKWNKAHEKALLINEGSWHINEAKLDSFRNTEDSKNQYLGYVTYGNDIFEIYGYEDTSNIKEISIEHSVPPEEYECHQGELKDFEFDVSSNGLCLDQYRELKTKNFPHNGFRVAHPYILPEYNDPEDPEYGNYEEAKAKFLNVDYLKKRVCEYLVDEKLISSARIFEYSSMKNLNMGFYQQLDKAIKKHVSRLAQKSNLTQENVENLSKFYNDYSYHAGYSKDDKRVIEKMAMDGLSSRNIKAVFSVMNQYHKEKEQLNEKMENILHDPDIKKIISRAKNQEIDR